MLRLKITPNEFAAMIYFMRGVTQSEWFTTRPLQSQTVNSLVMMQYLSKWNNQRLTIWLLRKRKAYTISIPLALARALHQEMGVVYLGPWEQIFLNTLDEAIINYRNPLTEAHVLGELVGR